MSGRTVAMKSSAHRALAVAEAGLWRRYALAFGFLLPALFLLGIWIVYPTVRTIVRSFFSDSGGRFVWFDNYKQLFTSDILLTALKNNAIWLAVVPALVTAIGLIFAVLTERVSWSLAFKTAVFMPLAVSAFAAGITWRLVYLKDPDQGALNAGIRVAKDAVSVPGVLSEASPSTPSLSRSGGGLVLRASSRPGQVVQLGLTGIPPGGVPKGAVQAAIPRSTAGAIDGVVWRDFKPGGGAPGRVEQSELGLPGVTVQLQRNSRTVESATTEPNGTFAFHDVKPGSYRVGIGAKTFAKPFAGISWLGASLITPAVIIAYIWIWAGFAMVVIAAGLSAIPRDLLEAARTDGGTEWQVFRRVTVPLLAPVLSVVLITMVINVLKVFDIVIAVAPESVQPDANVLALALWRTAFSGSAQFGVGSAIAVLIFVLVLPILLLNIRRFRREA
jgi:alpha-glucoside transport system permease protein